MESEKSDLPQKAVAQPAKFDNRALNQEPRYEPAKVIPLKRDSSLLDWLEGNGRLIARDKVEQPQTRSEGEDDMSGLIDDDDRDYDLDDDDDFEGDD